MSAVALEDIFGKELTKAREHKAQKQAARAEERETTLAVLDAGFALFRSPDGTERVYSVNARREATLQLEDAHLRKSLSDWHKGRFGAPMPSKDVNAAVAEWRLETVPLQAEPEPFAFTPGELAPDAPLAFKRFAWEPTTGPFPAWEEFLSRLSDRDAFMAFVWGVFEARNQGRQFVWLHGAHGEDGKSMVLRALSEVFGPGGASITGTSVRDPRFLFSSLFGKRLVVYADCKNPAFAMSETVRNLTSGDPVPIEFKGMTPFNGRLHTKLMVASNSAPEITSGNADLSRCLYIAVARSRSDDDTTWPVRLEAELPGFLGACRAVYGAACPGHGKIAVSKTTAELRQLVAAQHEADFVELFGKYFELAEGAEMHGADVLKRLRFAGLDDNRRVRDFKEWLERQGITVGRNTTNAVVYVGMRERKGTSGTGRAGGVVGVLG